MGSGRTPDGNERKEVVSLRFEPTLTKKLLEEFGSVQKAVDSRVHLGWITRLSNKRKNKKMKKG